MKNSWKKKNNGVVCDGESSKLSLFVARIVEGVVSEVRALWSSCCFFFFVGLRNTEEALKKLMIIIIVVGVVYV